MRITIFIFFALTFFGCAIGRKVNFEGIMANVPSFNQKISIATWDQREQIIKGTQQTNFVGYTRSMAGIPYPASTKSGRDFATILSDDFSASLSAKGSPTKVVTTKKYDLEYSIVESLKNSGGNRLVLVKCNLLHTDGYSTIKLLYNLDVTVYSETGTVIKRKNISGEIPIQQGPQLRKVQMPDALTELIETIFNDSDISSALHNS